MLLQLSVKGSPLIFIFDYMVSIKYRFPFLDWPLTNIVCKTSQICSWSIDRIPKDKAPSLTGTLVLEAGFERLHVFPTFQAEFRIMGVALSGLKMDKLEVKNVANRPYKGFRALTRAGEYEVRS